MMLNLCWLCLGHGAEFAVFSSPLGSEINSRVSKSFLKLYAVFRQAWSLLLFPNNIRR